MVTVEDVREVARRLPRSAEHLIRDRVKFRVGKIVYVAFSRDETVMGFGFPREERAALVASAPRVFHLPDAVNMRFQWVQAWMGELDQTLMEELVIDAWRMVVPKKVAGAYVAGLADR
ncbi:MmcQ/YjbR family DNA-binding protein [Actinoplanes sp. NPDC049265]|uniref:MmcQ/YjbR family DNA-binding protein n=1 Tax=Actinoplanes sp. NPDC049265 TaxID=3363902 RepID=UPI003714EC65